MEEFACIPSSSTWWSEMKQATDRISRHDSPGGRRSRIELCGQRTPRRILTLFFNDWIRTEMRKVSANEIPEDQARYF